MIDYCVLGGPHGGRRVTLHEGSRLVIDDQLGHNEYWDPYGLGIWLVWDWAASSTSWMPPNVSVRPAAPREGGGS